MKNIFRLDNKVALVTGSTSGMGKAIAEILGLHGAEVIVSSNDTGACENTRKEFIEKGIEAIAIPCDVSKKEAIDILIKEAEEKAGNIDILVNCVGVAIAGSFLDINTADFEKTMQINLQAAIYLTKKVIPAMQVKKDGAIIFFSKFIRC